jgi:hypothetical protein
MLKLLATLVATSTLQRFGDLLVGGIVLALVAYGAQNGLFLAVLAGMHALVSLVVALAFANPLAALLVSFELPAAYAFPAAFGILLVATAVGIRLAVGGYVPADVVRFAPMIDKLGGGLMGAVAGIIVAGTALIACSIAPLPEAFRIDGSKLGYDMGTRMLRTFARCVEPNDAKRKLLLDGEQAPQADAANGLLCSEPFVDGNRNGTFDGTEEPKERYLDEDGNGSFTPTRPFEDVNENGRRDIGLLESYRLGAWRDVRVMHVPTITSPDSATVPTEVEDGATVYRAANTDLDPGDTATFAIRVLPKRSAPADRQPAGKAAGGEQADDDAPDPALQALLAIDPASGAVTLPDVAALAAAHEPLEFVLIVTDQHGQTAEKTVTVHHKGIGKKKTAAQRR